jgi:hypothetical protein
MTAGKQLDSSAAGVKTAGVRRQKKNWSVGVTEHWNSIKQANIPFSIISLSLRVTWKVTFYERTELPALQFGTGLHEAAF